MIKFKQEFKYRRYRSSISLQRIVHWMVMKRFSNEIDTAGSTGTSLRLSNDPRNFSAEIFASLQEIRKNIQKCEADAEYHFLHITFQFQEWDL